MVLYLFIFRILDLLNTILVICRCSVLCLITCFFNYTALYLLPLAIIVDWGIFQFSIQSVFKNQLLDLNKAVEEFKEQGIDLEIIEDDIIKEIDTEMRKYQLFQWGNRQGDKRTIVSGQTNCSDNSKVLRFIMHLLSYSFPRHFIRNP